MMGGLWSKGQFLTMGIGNTAQGRDTILQPVGVINTLPPPDNFGAGLLRLGAFIRQVLRHPVGMLLRRFPKKSIF